MLVVDANVLLHAVNTASPHHARARERLAQWSAVPGQIGLTWSIVYEFLRVATHPAVFPKPLRFADAWSFVDALLSQARARVLVATDDHASLLAGAAAELPDAAGSRFHDLHTALLMREHGVAEIQTADTDFHRFPWVRAVNPLAG